MDDYEKQAEKFLKDTKTTFKAEFLMHDKHFPDDKEPRDIYTITLTRGTRTYSFDFGQSINESGFKLINTNTNQEVKYTWMKECYDLIKPLKRADQLKQFRQFVVQKIGALGCFQIKRPKTPTPYSVLSSLTNHEVGSLKDFCSNYGYDTDSKKAETTYKAVLEEYKQVCILWTDKEIEQLQEIQ